MGNSAGIILPKPLLLALGVEVGRQFDVAIEDGRIIATPVQRAMREGWEAAAEDIGASDSTDEEQHWLDLDSDASTGWTW